VTTSTRSATSAERFVTVAELQEHYGLARSVAYRVAAQLGPRRAPAGLYERDLAEWLRAHPGYSDPDATPRPP
jgi:hypothetical protein